MNKIDYSIQRYKDGKFSFGQAAEYSSLSVWAFADILRARKVAMSYDRNDIEHDLKTIRWKK